MKRAYRFLPLADDGRARESSQYTLTTWEVVELRPGKSVGRSTLLASRDASGGDPPLAGTLVCRGVR